MRRLPVACQTPVAGSSLSLKDAGLIVGEIEGPRICYWASRERLAELHELVGGVLEDAVEVDITGCD